MKIKKLFLILGNQLFPTKFLKNYKNLNFFMCEDYGLCTNKKHHKLKLILFLSSMRSYADKLRKENFKLTYLDLTNKFEIPYITKLEEHIKKNNITQLISFEIEDKFFEKNIRKLIKTNSIQWSIIQNPMFLTSRKEFKEYLSSTKKPFMANFYKIVRQRHEVLMSQGKPKGGKWSYDKENRKKIPKGIKIPPMPKINETLHTKKLKKIVQKKFSSHPGNVDDFWLPTLHEDADNWLNFFLKEKLNFFGDFEDAVDKNNNILFHSVLSPLLNMGLITPAIVLKKIQKFESTVKINSYEGFIRQIIGWREFIRGIYQNFNTDLEKNNFFSHKKSMTRNWYNGTTGLKPLDHSIKNALKYGWTHHIERLMLISNLMNLCEIQPKEAYNWFMEMFVDSSEWVMVPNLYGMGLYSDGGIFSTKPYICGSNYIMKMMNFEKGEWNKIMDGLYWRFINKNRNFFLKNPRLSMMVKIFDKMNNTKKDYILSQAEIFIKKNTL